MGQGDQMHSPTFTKMLRFFCCLDMDGGGGPKTMNWVWETCHFLWWLKVPDGQIGSVCEWNHWIGIEKDINCYGFSIFYCWSWIFDKSSKFCACFDHDLHLLKPQSFPPKRAQKMRERHQVSFFKFLLKTYCFCEFLFAKNIHNRRGCFSVAFSWMCSAFKIFSGKNFATVCILRKWKHAFHFNRTLTVNHRSRIKYWLGI